MTQKRINKVVFVKSSLMFKFFYSAKVKELKLIYYQHPASGRQCEITGDFNIIISPVQNRGALWLMFTFISLSTFIFISSAFIVFLLCVTQRTNFKGIKASFKSLNLQQCMKLATKTDWTFDLKWMSYCFIDEFIHPFRPHPFSSEVWNRH